jgi:hypothetical protein
MESTKHKASTLIKEHNGKWCTKRICSLAFCGAAVAGLFCLIFADIPENLASGLSQIIITFAAISGGTNWMTTAKNEKQ